MIHTDITAEYGYFKCPNIEMLLQKKLLLFVFVTKEHFCWRMYIQIMQLNK